MSLTATEAAAYIGRITGKKPHVSTVIRWIDRGARGRRLPAIRQGAQWIIDERDAEAFLQYVNTRTAPVLPAVEAARLEVERHRLDALLGRSAGGETAPPRDDAPQHRRRPAR